MNIRNSAYNDYITNQLPYYSPYFYNPEYGNTNQYYSGKKKYIMGQNEWTSLYIPIIDGSCTKEYLKTIIENKYMIGRISRIDLVRLKDNSYSHVDDCSAFIHFRHWYYNPFTVKLREHLSTYKSYNIKYYYNSVMNIPGDYFVIMKNKSLGMGGKKRSSSSGDSLPDNNLGDTLLKQQKRIELLEDELDVLRKLIEPKI